MQLALAPMEGVTDDVVRELFGALGGVDWCVTEFIRVSESVLSAKVLLRECPELTEGSRTRDGVPVHLQLLGGHAERVAASASIAVSLGAQAIDLNFGCPAPTVNRHDGGASLLKDPRRVCEVTAAVRKAIPSTIPVSAKVRLGWENPDDIVTIARAAEDGGAAWLTVHGRTKVQGYKPPADWVRIGLARDTVKIPVIANGDLRSLEDLERCRALTGCDRFMLGRGAIERPELFGVLRGTRPGFLSPFERLALLPRFVERSLARGAGRENVTLARAKQWLRAMSLAEPVLVPCFDEFKRETDLSRACAVLQNWIANGSSKKEESSRVQSSA